MTGNDESEPRRHPFDPSVSSVTTLDPMGRIVRTLASMPCAPGFRFQVSYPARDVVPPVAARR